MPPTESFIRANGLRHHVLEWKPQGAPKETVVLCHGFLDIGWSWNAVGERLAEQGYRAVAFDWRGHGETEWIGAGGYYHFLDYVLDLAELTPQLTNNPFFLVGHSMGGGAATMFTGTCPERVKKLVVMEGLGPPPSEVSDAPMRARTWVDGVAKVRSKAMRAMPNVAAVLERMRMQNPELPEELGLFLAEKSTRRTDDGLVWTFDPLHRTMSPLPFRPELFAAFCKNISCPTLLMFGTRGFRLPDEAERIAHFRNARSVELGEVSHMMHWLAPSLVAGELVRFFDDR